MPPPVYPVSSVGGATYSFNTYAGKAISVRITTNLSLATAVLSLWVDKNSKFSNETQVGSVQLVDGALVISLNQTEVDQVQDSYYYVRAVKGTETARVVSGQITYKVEPVDDSSLLDENGNIRIEFVAPLVVALEDTFLRRDEYVAGVVDPEVLNAAVATQLDIHVNSSTPHPAYDIDAPSFKLLFENGLI